MSQQVSASYDVWAWTALLTGSQTGKSNWHVAPKSYKWQSGFPFKLSWQSTWAPAFDGLLIGGGAQTCTGWRTTQGRTFKTRNGN